MRHLAKVLRAHHNISPNDKQTAQHHVGKNSVGSPRDLNTRYWQSVVDLPELIHSWQVMLMFDFLQPVLRTDISGMPLEWIDFKRAVTLITLDQVAYTCGDFELSVKGGRNRLTGRRSTVEINSIIATRGHFRSSSSDEDRYSPPLLNLPLFQRDGYLCMYCGDQFPYRELSRDHVTPFSQGGQDVWSNVVTACVRCNNYKAGRTPEQAGMSLLAVPFAPTRAEFIYLQGKRILADQMEFLKSHFPRTSPLRGRA